MSEKKPVVLPKKFRHMKMLEQRIKAGELCDIATAAALTGYSEAHLRKLCKRKKIAHIRKHGLRDWQYWFEPKDLEAVWSRVEAQP
jgi:hypothetical protein